MLWSRFWNWYSRHVLESIVITATILYLQIPHMLWVGDLWWFSGQYIAGINTPVDFFLYGVDLIEIMAIINITFLIYAKLRERINNAVKK